MEFNHSLAQQNKDFYGYTVFTLDFNGVPIRFVTEKDALNIIEKLKDSQDDTNKSEVKE